MSTDRDEGYLPDEEIEALLNESYSEEEAGDQPLYQRKWLKQGIGFLLVFMLVGNILAFWPQVYSMHAIQFLKTSARLSQDESIQSYKKAVVVIKNNNRKGTGFNISKSGLILTNYHVVAGNPHPIAQFSDGRSFTADWVAGNEDMDIALLQITGDKLPVLPLAAQTEEAGTPFYVIGNPLFFHRIANEGVLLGWHPLLNPSRLMLSAPIYKGNSGSPVINREGLVIAIVYATTEVVVDGSMKTVGLAIPIEQVLAFLQEQGIFL